MFRTPTVSNAGEGANPCWMSSSCRCPDGCPMDISETDAKWIGSTADMEWEMGADRCPFDGQRCLWPCSPSCRCAGECPMDITEMDISEMDVIEMDVPLYADRFELNGQNYTWPTQYNASDTTIDADVCSFAEPGMLDLFGSFSGSSDDGFYDDNEGDI